MYVIQLKMEELMPYESIVKKTLTDKCLKVFDIAKKYDTTTYRTEFPYILFDFEEENKAINFYIDTKNLVDYIDIAKGEQKVCQEEVN